MTTVLLDQSGNVIKPVELEAPPGKISNPLRLTLYLARQFPPLYLASDDRSGHETVRFGLRVIPIGSMDLTTEEAGNVEQFVPGTGGLLLEAVERDGETERSRWFLVTTLVNIGVARQQARPEEVTE